MERGNITYQNDGTEFGVIEIGIMNWDSSVIHDGEHIISVKSVT